MVATASGSPSVEPVLELLAVLGFPRLDGQAVLLLDLVPVPLWDHVERAEGDDVEVVTAAENQGSNQTTLYLDSGVEGASLGCILRR